MPYCFVSAFLIVCGQLATGLCERPQQLGYQVIEWPDYDGRTLVLGVENPFRSGLRTSYHIVGRFKTVEAVLRTDSGHLVVLGDLPRGGDICAVLNEDSGEQITTLLGYGLFLSPEGNFLVVKTWYPRMIDPDLRRSILVLVDLRRRDSALGQLRFPSGSGSQAFRPVYPATNLEENSLSNGLETRHLFLSPILWSEDESGFVFVQLSDGITSLVFIELTGQVRLREQLIDINSLVLPEYHGKEYLAQVTNRYKLAIEEISWISAEEVQLTPYPQYWLPSQFTIRLPASDMR